MRISVTFHFWQLPAIENSNSKYSLFMVKVDERVSSIATKKYQKKKKKKKKSGAVGLE